MKKFLLICFCSALLVACEKDQPSSDDRAKFLGTWNISANGSVSGHLAYAIEIIAGNSSESQVVIKNFDFQGNSTSTYGEISGNSLTIASQSVNGSTIEGSGSYSSEQLSFNYTVVDGLTTDHVTATGIR